MRISAIQNNSLYRSTSINRKTSTFNNQPESQVDNQTSFKGFKGGLKGFALCAIPTTLIALLTVGMPLAGMAGSAFGIIGAKIGHLTEEECKKTEKFKNKFFNDKHNLPD